jgi:hypothetical protein
LQEGMLEPPQPASAVNRGCSELMLMGGGEWAESGRRVDWSGLSIDGRVSIMETTLTTGDIRKTLDYRRQRIHDDNTRYTDDNTTQTTGENENERSRHLDIPKS